MNMEAKKLSITEAVREAEMQKALAFQREKSRGGWA